VACTERRAAPLAAAVRLPVRPLPALLLPALLLLLLLGLPACTPHVDEGVLRGLSPALRAPAETVRMDLLVEQRALEQARRQEGEAAAGRSAAEQALARTAAAAPDAPLRRAELELARHAAERSRLEVEVAERRVALASARYELAKARLVEEQNLPQAERIDLGDFTEQERRSRAELNRSVLRLTTLGQQEEQLTAAVRSERLRLAGAGPGPR